MPIVRTSRCRYTEADLVLFGQYRDERSDHAPVACDGGKLCWVRDGPPACQQTTSYASSCLGCGGAIR